MASTASKTPAGQGQGGPDHQDRRRFRNDGGEQEAHVAHAIEAEALADQHALGIVFGPVPDGLPAIRSQSADNHVAQIAEAAVARPVEDSRPQVGSSIVVFVILAEYDIVGAEELD